MLFNSLDFAVFLPIVFILYWSIKKEDQSYKNILLIFASYTFYGWWDWRFLILIFMSSTVDYLIGLQLNKTIPQNQRIRKRLLLISIMVNLGTLAFFKYYNFFTESFVDAFSFFGNSIELSSLDIVLPVGISFYTFQTLSYTIDVYNRRMEPTKSFVTFFAFVSFFPQLVAGPIERAKHLIPQFESKRKFSNRFAETGLLDIAWGLFKKVVVADSLAKYVDVVYSDVNSFEGFPIAWATIFFAFQIYCDFSGYSSIAIGTAKLFGFELMQNFKRPYFSASFKTFWSRWHISLSTWFRDYVYIPLGGNKTSVVRSDLNLLITFVLSGLWHGANWTFVIWGGLHGFARVLEKRISRFNPFPNILNIALIFLITSILWVFFRAENLADALYILQNLVPSSLDSIIGVPVLTKAFFIKLILFVSFLVFIEIIVEIYLKRKKVGSDLYPKSSHIRLFSILLFALIYIFGSFEKQEFIYFQF